MTKEQKFYKALQDVFIGAKIEGEGGFVNLMRIKSNYYRKIEDILKTDIEAALTSHPKFRDELFDKLYSFFSRYFTASGSIYFNSTPFHNNIYEKVYTDEKDVILFWKTQMLYYVKTDRIFRSLPVEFSSSPLIEGVGVFRGVDAEGGRGVHSPFVKGCSEGTGYLKFYFDASKIESKKANEKRSLVFELNKVREDNTIVFDVSYSEKGTKTKQDELLKAIKRKGLAITEEQLERAFRVFEKQSEVDFFINKNAKAFLQEQFKLWSYQYFWEGAKEWSADRVNQLQILKDIAFKIIDFISQFEDELVKIWNKPKFVKNSNYVITLDKIVNSPLQKGWHSEGMTGYSTPLIKGCPEGTGYLKLPYNPELKERARELRKSGNLSEVLLWNNLKQKKMLGFDFTRQQVIGDYIVDFYCARLRLVIEIDGQSHDFKGEYDEKRDEYLQSLGLTVLRFKDIDVKKELNAVVEQMQYWIKENTPSASQTPLLRKGELLIEKIRKHKNYPQQIKEWEELGIDKENPKAPIDTKYFKDLELEILSQFDDLDKSLDGWLIKSENYQALNTILPKFKEKVQTIYIDPPFNLDSSDQFLYRTNYKDANWATLLENRLRIARNWLNEKGSIFVRCDYNGNWIVRCLIDDIFGKENFRNEIIVKRGAPKAEMFKQFEGIKSIGVMYDNLYFYTVNPNTRFNKFKISIKRREGYWSSFYDMKPSGERPTMVYELLGLYPPKGYYWKWSKTRALQGVKNYDEYIKSLEQTNESIEDYSNRTGIKDFIKKENNKIRYYIHTKDETFLDNNWLDIQGYSVGWKFQTENAEILLKRVIESTSNRRDLVMDFFLGSGTTTAVAHKLGRKWLGVEMGEHFYSVVLPRMKKVLAYDKSGISKELKTPRQTLSDTPLEEGNYQGGGFFKYYELEQYEEALANCKYADGDMFNSPFVKGWHSEGMTGYSQYVFMKDEKMLKALEIDYEKEKVKIDLSNLYPSIDIAETLSNLTGKWIKTISADEVEFENGTKINLKDLDYKPIRPLIWW